MEERHGKETTQAAVHCVIVVLMYSNGVLWLLTLKWH
jgi:hypothetical protein